MTILTFVCTQIIISEKTRLTQHQLTIQTNQINTRRVRNTHTHTHTHTNPIPSAPIPANLTPLDWMKFSAFPTLAILCTLIFPFFSAGGSFSPEMISSSFSSVRPSRKSTLISLIWTPTFLKCELHQAVKVWRVK